MTTYYMHTHNGGGIGMSCGICLVDDTCNPRPVVVIDPADDDQVLRLVMALRAEGWSSYCVDTAAALRRLIAPPKPPEPMGLGAVVEADGGVLYVRDQFGVWMSEDESQPWRNVNAVKVLSEGVTR